MRRAALLLAAVLVPMEESDAKHTYRVLQEL